jgi:hypothetical protein
MFEQTETITDNAWTPFDYFLQYKTFLAVNNFRGSALDNSMAYPKYTVHTAANTAFVNGMNSACRELWLPTPTGNGIIEGHTPIADGMTLRDKFLHVGYQIEIHSTTIHMNHRVYVCYPEGPSLSSYNRSPMAVNT